MLFIKKKTMNKQTNKQTKKKKKKRKKKKLRRSSVHLDCVFAEVFSRRKLVDEPADDI